LVSEGNFTVYPGLDIPYQKMATLIRLPQVFYLDEQPGADVYNPDDESFFEKISVTPNSRSLMNLNLAPEGKSSFMIQAICPADWMQNWGGGNHRKYKQLKEKVKKRSLLV
jgi:hypothetical protein